MINTFGILRAIRFATKTHEVDQKQKRKGKDVAYITHPLTVGIILACASADENTIIAGILHDTIEDSIAEKKVSKELLVEQFGERVATLVDWVTEKDKSMSWEGRKHEALLCIKNFSHEALLVKSADVISNIRELLDDYAKDEIEVFARFNAPKERILKHHLELIRTIIECWPENPLISELSYLATQLQMIGASFFMINYRAPVIKYRDYDEKQELECPVCGWHGVTEANTDSHFALDISCPICDKMLLVAEYPQA